MIFILGVIINLACWVFLLYSLEPTDHPVPLHYNIYFGIDLIGNWYHLYFMPLSGLVILLVNAFLLKSLREKEIFIKYVIVAASSFCQLIILIATIFIVTQTGL